VSASALPDRRQELLLRAALFPAPSAVEAWCEWRRDVALEDLDRQGFRLLPLAAHRVAPHLADDALLARCRGIARRTWVRNQELLAAAAPVVRALGAEGIPVLLLKGAALAAECYGSLSLRPMNDVDLLVPTSDGARARGVLARLGWRPGYAIAESRLARIHALGYRDDRGREIDLHWHALWECCQPEADRALWERARPVTLGPVQALRLDPADEVLHVCAHGLRWSDPPAVHWVADLVLHLRVHAGRLDWTRVLEQATTRSLSLQLAITLALAADRFGAPVPAHVLTALRARHPGLRERLEVAARMRPPALLRGLFLHWCDHRRLSEEEPAWRRLTGFPRHLQAAWGVPSAAHVPAVALGKVARRLASR